MGSVRGFRCQRCRGELLATEPGRLAWTPPVLCCGVPLQPLAPEQILAGGRLGGRGPGRLARCPRCGYQVRLVVHPAGPLVCMSCQQPFALAGRALAGAACPAAEPDA